MIAAMNSWKEILSQTLNNSRRPAVVGIGQELRGDDAAGVLAVRILQSGAISTPQGRAAPEGTLFLFEAGSLPEASAGPLRRFRPDWVIFIDAADMGEAPGTVRWIDPDQAGGFSGSTHTLPLSGFSAYLSSAIGCQVAILGIQPKHLDFDVPVSDEVLKSIKEIAALISGESRHTFF